MTNGSDSAFTKTGVNKTDEDARTQRGLTKREYFAAMILQGLMANPERYKYISDAIENDGMPQSLATEKNCNKAVKIADALIEALNKETVGK